MREKTREWEDKVSTEFLGGGRKRMKRTKRGGGRGVKTVGVKRESTM